MMEFVILLLLSTLCAAIYSHFRAEKKFLVGKEKEETLQKMDTINNKVLELMKEVPSNIKDYTLNVIVKDGEVSRVTTETDLAKRMIILDDYYETSTYQKGFTKKTAKIIAFIYSFLFSFCFIFLVYTLLMEYLR